MKNLEENKKLIEKTPELSFLLDPETKEFKGDLNLTTVINGNLEYTSKNEINFSEGTVLGEVTYHKYSSIGALGKCLLSFLIGLAMLLIYVLVIFFVTKKLSFKCLDKASKLSPMQLLISLGIGIGLVIVTPLLFLLLCLSQIGALLALLIVIVYILLALLSVPTIISILAEFLKNTIGDTLLAGKVSDKVAEYLYLIDATILFALLMLIPFVNVILVVLTVLIGTGSLALTAFKKESAEIIP